MSTTGSFRKCLLAWLMSALLLLAPALPQAALAAPPQAAKASPHVVSPAELQRDLDAVTAKRQARIDALQHFLSTPKARRALKSAGMNYQVVNRAVPLLSSQELARLSARAEKAQKQFVAGSLTNQELTYIIIALATAVIIIIIVKA
jgi:hypothetical protein